ncbi:hypothetical protein Patl1_34747 [Pistacia atlantica]|uniref:Uncharacterized protein n=1 Tax=Pistacia atlantica TaxID=434234 RepID=A0ACC0ZS55_9ROSI|nr:hypothetical protein Patl1_34747 [Pistacia atlantica]
MVHILDWVRPCK